MDTSFWHERWESNQTAFHESEAHPMLVKYFDAAKGSRIFVPLCGKTLDIAWLLANGYRVAGAELSKIAIDQLFTQLALVPTITRAGALDHYCAENIDIFVGNIFDLTGELLGPVDAIYDRAALVALPADMRAQYTKHLLAITGNVPQLLICLEYDQALQDGPPFSISSGEVSQHYRNTYQLTLLESAAIPGGLKGKCPAQENAWRLSK